MTSPKIQLSWIDKWKFTLRMVTLILLCFGPVMGKEPVNDGNRQLGQVGRVKEHEWHVVGVRWRSYGGLCGYWNRQ